MLLRRLLGHLCRLNPPPSRHCDVSCDTRAILASTACTACAVLNVHILCVAPLSAASRRPLIIAVHGIIPTPPCPLCSLRAPHLCPPPFPFHLSPQCVWLLHRELCGEQHRLCKLASRSVASRCKRARKQPQRAKRDRDVQLRRVALAHLLLRGLGGGQRCHERRAPPLPVHLFHVHIARRQPVQHAPHQAA